MLNWPKVLSAVFAVHLTIGSYVSVRSSRYEARGKFGEHERCVRVARGYASKFFSRGICLLTSWASTIGIWSTLAQLNSIRQIYQLCYKFFCTIIIFRLWAMVSVVAFRTLWLISSALYTVADPLKMVCCLKVLSLVLLQSSFDCFCPLISLSEKS